MPFSELLSHFSLYGRQKLFLAGQVGGKVVALVVLENDKRVGMSWLMSYHFLSVAGPESRSGGVWEWFCPVCGALMV